MSYLLIREAADAGEISMDDTVTASAKAAVLSWTADGTIRRPMNNSWTYLFREAYIREAQAFVDAIVDDAPVRVTGHDGKMAVRLVNMGLESLLSGSVVHDERHGA